MPRALISYIFAAPPSKNGTFHWSSYRTRPAAPRIHLLFSAGPRSIAGVATWLSTEKLAALPLIVQWSMRDVSAEDDPLAITTVRKGRTKYIQTDPIYKTIQSRIYSSSLTTHTHTHPLTQLQLFKQLHQLFHRQHAVQEPHPHPSRRRWYCLCRSQPRR